MGKPNPAKLANFPEVEVFVLVADPDGLILDSKVSIGAGVSALGRRVLMNCNGSRVLFTNEKCARHIFAGLLCADHHCLRGTDRIHSRQRVDGRVLPQVRLPVGELNHSLCSWDVLPAIRGGWHRRCW